MRTPIFRFVLAIALVALVGLAVVIFRPAPAPPALPSPNGYDDFVAAGEALVGNPSDFRQWSQEELTSFVAGNSNVWSLVQAGLRKECRAPAIRNQAQMQKLMSRMATLKSLARALGARSRLARLEGRTNEAVRICLDGVQMANGIGRGGTIIEALVDMACENIALEQLSKTLNSLDVETAIAAARRLAELDARNPGVTETVSNERAFSRSFGGLVGTYWVMADRLFGRGLLASGRKQFEAKWIVQTTRRRQIILQLARRAFEVENGRPPKNDSELVPDFLSELPTIPTVNTNQAPQAVRP